ncbi:MAG: aspartate-semialdehyde dehydrogenase [Thermicanus sp.]|nr:aspartate-semialdehyde dehydrogenase [Thermicanus sp.]
MTKKYRVAVVGATGAVGREMVHQLEERNFPVGDLLLLASSRSAGTTLEFHGESVLVKEATPDQFEGVEIALFSAGGKVSKMLAPEAVKRGAVVIDNSNAFRMEEEVPLVVPEVNEGEIFKHKGIIANPNCSTIQMVVALKPLRDRLGLKRVIVSTYQAVSGAGAKAVAELMEESKAILAGTPVEAKILPVASLPVKHQIAFNAIPQIDVFQENGFTLEEMKMVRETKKIFGDPSIQVAATCVRIPVRTGHSESVYVETKEPIPDLAVVRKWLTEAPGVVVVDQPEEQRYPLATDAEGKREVFVGRIRKDLNDDNGLHLWIVSDNLLKGAAWNAVQIAERLIAR